MQMKQWIFKRRSTQYQKSLIGQIRDQDWDAVREAIQLQSGASKAACGQRSPSSSLALAVSLNPPSDVVASLLQLDPAAAFQPDQNGRLPLHVACSTGASVDVVHLLLLAESPSAGEQELPGNVDVALCADIEGRVPLHYAAEYATGSYGETLDVVVVLCAACPVATSVKDAWGETPSDVAAQMEDAALLDSDHEMVEAARAVRRIEKRAKVRASEEEKQNCLAFLL